MSAPPRPLHRRLLQAWMAFGRWMGDHVARLAFTAVYFSVVLPFGVGVRLTSDVLRRRAAPAWLPKRASADTLETARRSF
jgi:hypothetical protein